MNAMKRDETIRQAIESELRWMPVVDPGNVDVRVEDGVVTLAGHVVDASARQAVDQLARRVLGVRSVANQIQVRHLAKDAQSDTALFRAVADAFGQGHQSRI